MVTTLPFLLTLSLLYFYVSVTSFHLQQLGIPHTLQATSSSLFAISHRSLGKLDHQGNVLWRFVEPE